MTVPKKGIESSSFAAEDSPQSEAAGVPTVMERIGKIEDLDRSFDIEFWQRQGTTAIFSAAWELIKLYHASLGENVDDLRLQRSVESFQRLPG